EEEGLGEDLLRVLAEDQRAGRQDHGEEGEDSGDDPPTPVGHRGPGRARLRAGPGDQRTGPRRRRAARGRRKAGAGRQRAVRKAGGKEGPQPRTGSPGATTDPTARTADRAGEGCMVRLLRMAREYNMLLWPGRSPRTHRRRGGRPLGRHTMSERTMRMTLP